MATTDAAQPKYLCSKCNAKLTKFAFTAKGGKALVVTNETEAWKWLSKITHIVPYICLRCSHVEFYADDAQQFLTETTTPENTPEG